MHLLLLRGSKHVLHEQIDFVLGPILNEPELLETLDSYLKHSENLKTTSEHLFLHVNTLKYRLQRISELLNCNLKDADTRFRLRMALTIEYYLRNSI